MSRSKGKPQSNRGKGNKFSPRQRSIESADMKSRIPNRFDADEKPSEDMHKCTPNDWRWYAANPQLIKDYASFPFGVPVGNKMGTGYAQADEYAVPGVMVYNFQPAIGWATAETDPINVAMRRMYAQVRRANSGATNYDPPDLMLYMLAVDSALMYLAYMKRAYAVMLDYTPYNRYYPKALLSAMNIDYADIEANLNDFRGYINIFAAKVAQLWVPNTLSLMARHTWMCEGLYTDNVTEKAQTYLYNPVSCYKFGLDTQGAGQLTVARMPTTAKLKDLIEYGDALIAPMITNQDFGIMAGDILKAFGENGIVKVYGITEDYKVVPTYNEEVLSQMENLVAINSNVTNNITQTTAVGTGYLVSQPGGAANIRVGGSPTQTTANYIARAYENYVTYGKVLNFHHSNPTPEEVMVATRLTTRINNVTGSAAGENVVLAFDIPVCGTEIVTGAYILTYKYGASGTQPTLLRLPVQSVYMTGISSGDNASTFISFMDEYLMGMAMLANFDWHHEVDIVMPYNASGEMGIAQGYKGVWDVAFYTTLTSNNLLNLHTTAMLSEFTVPMIGA